MKTFLAISVLVLVTLPACDKKESSAGTDEQNTSVPKGDPPFSPLGTSWIIDNAGVMDKRVVAQCHAICQKLQDDGVAEVVVLVQPHVKHPADYATHYGRWLKLGEKGLSTEGGNNGLVWLIIPDADEKMWYSRGRGLPRLTSNLLVDIMNKAKDYLNFNNYDQGILMLVQETDKQLREIHGKGA
jgi:uncharacterized membrane protein YgcG